MFVLQLSLGYGKDTHGKHMASWREVASVTSLGVSPTVTEEEALTQFSGSNIICVNEIRYFGDM